MIKNIYQEDKDSEQALFDALYRLMLDIPIDKITVSQILEEAHVSRSGFYRRYKDKYDLLNSTARIRCGIRSIPAEFPARP